jgi:hypothetical protein
MATATKMRTLTLKIGDDLLDAVDATAARQGIDRGGALRRGIALLDYLDIAARDGNKIMLTDADGTPIREIVFPGTRQHD